MVTTTDFFFDTLCLAFYSTDPTDKLLMRQVLEIYEANTDKYEQDTTGIFYVHIIKDILTDKYDLSIEGDISTMLRKYSHNPAVVRDNTVLEQLKVIIKDRDKISDSKRDHLRRVVRNWILWANSDLLTRQMFSKLQKIPMVSETHEQDVLLNEVLEKARAITNVFNEGIALIDGTVDFIDMSSKESVMKAVKSRKYAKDTNNTFKMGLQGLNKLFYPNAGPTRGESIAFIASSHHFKSGMLMSFARWVATLNPIPVTNGKPAIVFISLENEIYENLNQWFREAYSNAFHTEPDGLTDEEIVDYVTKLYSKCGYSLLVYRKLGDLFGINEYIALVEKLETEGYTIVASVIDYITLMKLPESQANPAKALQNLASTLFNYNKHKMITTATGLQLGTDADRLNDSGMAYVVKKYGTSHLADCRGLLRELDFAAFMYNEENTNTGFKYLTMAWKKHRYVPSIPKEYKYPAFPYTKAGIMDDIDREDSTVYDIYADDKVVDSSKQDVEDSLF